VAQGLRQWRWSLLAVLLAAWLGSGEPAQAQPADAAVDLGSRARNLEQTGRWPEAAEVYAELARRHPGVLAWQQHGRRCRTQDQITRRFLDPSFQQGLLQLPMEKALHLYAEVLAKIQAHYVEDVDLGRLLGAGMQHLDLALQNPAFLQAAFAVAPAEEALSRYRAGLPQRWPDLSAANRYEAQQKVQAVAIGLQQDLGAGPTAIVLEFVCAAGETLDDYSAYLSPERFALEKSLAQLDTAGIGVELQMRHGQLSVASLAPEGPAAKAGVQLHDQVLRIDGMSADRLGAEEASLRLLGRDKTKVALEVRGVLDTEPRQVEIVRQRCHAPSVDNVRMVDPEAGIGYLHLGVFQATTPEELDAALGRLVLLGLRALILDMRGNPGGSFEAGLQTADRFLAEGVIASTKGRTHESNAIFRTQDERALLVPLVVLVDGETASAAELVAGAIRDHRRGVLVGQRTAGKGTVQYIYPLKTVPSGLRLTAARYYSPLEIAFADNPVTPDIVVDDLETMDGMDSMMSMMDLQARQYRAALEAAREALMKN
jgi:carboxyl-terminal processing protease